MGWVYCVYSRHYTLTYVLRFILGFDMKVSRNLKLYMSPILLEKTRINGERNQFLQKLHCSSEAPPRFFCYSFSSIDTLNFSWRLRGLASALKQCKDTEKTVQWRAFFDVTITRKPSWSASWLLSKNSSTRLPRRINISNFTFLCLPHTHQTSF